MIKLVLLLFPLIMSCEKPFWDNTPKANIQVYGGYWYSDGAMACCYDYTLDGRMSQNVYRAKWEYLCDDGKVAIKTKLIDNVWWQEPNRVWVRLTVWNDDGESDSEIKYYTVKK